VSDDDTGQILSEWLAKQELCTLLCIVCVGGDAQARPPIASSMPSTASPPSTNYVRQDLIDPISLDTRQLVIALVR
jgi:hypothetical protein